MTTDIEKFDNILKHASPSVWRSAAHFLNARRMNEDLVEHAIEKVNAKWVHSVFNKHNLHHHEALTIMKDDCKGCDMLVDEAYNSDLAATRIKTRRHYEPLFYRCFLSLARFELENTATFFKHCIMDDAQILNMRGAFEVQMFDCTGNAKVHLHDNSTLIADNCENLTLTVDGQKYGVGIPGVGFGSKDAFIKCVGGRIKAYWGEEAIAMMNNLKIKEASKPLDIWSVGL